MASSTSRPAEGQLHEIARRAMLEHGLLPGFQGEALAEANALPEAVLADRSGAPIQDLRQLPWLSIDKRGSRTLDQVTTAEAQDRAARLLVAIADIDSLVPRGSALDRRARHNARSIYTPAATFPLLPKRIATDLGSLREGKDRLAVVVEMMVEEDGMVSASSLLRAQVRNQARLTFEEVSDWLEDRGALPKRLMKMSVLKKQVRLHAEAAGWLRRRRHEPGASPTARDLVEELMTATSEAMASFLESHGLPSLDTHSTAPSRRYADLVIQRLLKAALAGAPPPYTGAELAELADGCSRREDAAAEVERWVEAVSTETNTDK